MDSGELAYNSLKNEAREHLCSILAENLYVLCLYPENLDEFCLYPETLSEAELKGSGLISLGRDNFKTAQHSGTVNGHHSLHFINSPEKKKSRAK